MRLTCIFEEAAEGGYVAYVEEIPGANAQGETLDEARANLREAIELVLQTNRELAAEARARRGTRAIQESLILN